MRINFKTLARIIGEGTRLDAITKPIIGNLVATMTSEGSSPATINRKLALLGKLLRLNEDAFPGKLPRIPHLTEYAGRKRYLKGSEETALLAAISKRESLTPQPSPWNAMAALVVTLMDTGLRLGEALALREGDVDHIDKRVHVWASKGDISRTIPLTERAAQALWNQGPAVFTKLTKDSAEYMWRTVRADLGLSGDTEMVLHCLRHTCATRLVQAGMSIKKVQQWMGHRQIETTLIYAHLETVNLNECRDVLERCTTSSEPQKVAELVDALDSGYLG